MRQVLNARVRESMLIALAIAAPACNMGEGGSAAGGSEQTGSLQAAITVGGLRHDVTSVHYKIVSAGGACSDPAIAETTSALEEESLPNSVLPPGANTHAGADGLFALPPGNYLICATPMAESGPSLECAPTQGTALVVPESTTEMVLVSQCAGDVNGGVDVGVALNDPPLISDIDVAPSKFITECESATITVTAEDPDGDAISYGWELIAGAGTLATVDNVAQFTPDGAGDATLKVTVTDAIGGSAALTFPIHVSAADCPAAACQVFGTDAFGYEGCFRTEEVPSCDDISLTGSLACNGDDCVTNVALPFVFDYYGTPRTSVDIVSNGKLGFPGTNSFANTCSVEPETIAPFWDDLLPQAGGAVRYETLGSAPERRFVVQWNVPHITGGSLLDVRAVLFEGSNDVRFCYADTTVENPTVDSGASATAGISGTTSSLLYSCEAPQLTDGLVVEFAHPGGPVPPTCTDGTQNGGETGVDCGGPCIPCGGGGAAVIAYIDTPGDDVSSTVLFDFFTNLGPVNPSQYIMFQVDDAQGGGGAWCSDNADFYVNNYLIFGATGAFVNSGSWAKYARPLGGSWSGPDTTQYTNYFGVNCDGNPYAWCSEWGVGNQFLGLTPASPTNGEVVFSNGLGWSVTVAVGPDRLSTCGF
jgi:PKD domain